MRNRLIDHIGFQQGSIDINYQSLAFLQSMTALEMYQLEVKHLLVKHYFPPDEGWNVTVDIDAMERAIGNQHKADKRSKVDSAERALVALGAAVGAHPQFGRVDIVPEHPVHGCFLTEVEGQSANRFL